MQQIIGPDGLPQHIIPPQLIGPDGIAQIIGPDGLPQPLLGPDGLPQQLVGPDGRPVMLHMESPMGIEGGPMGGIPNDGFIPGSLMPGQIEHRPNLVGGGRGRDRPRGQRGSGTQKQNQDTNKGNVAYI